MTSVPINSILNMSNMLAQFILQNAHFALNTFVAMVFSWIFFLYFDVWLARRDYKQSLKFIGFLLLTLSFVIHAVSVETSAISVPLLLENLGSGLLVLTRISGYVFIITGLFLEKSLKHPSVGIALIPGVEISYFVFGSLTFPLLATAIALLYLHKATYGQEFHLRPVAFGFFVLALYELLSLSELLQGSSNVAIFKSTAPFSTLWIITHIALFIAAAVLAKWVFGYLLKRLLTQLYIFFSLAILLIFIVSVVAFTSLLLINVQNESLDALETNVKVLEYALNSKKSELTSDMEVFAQNQNLIDAVKINQATTLARLSSEFLLSQNLSFLVVVDADGRVIARGEEPERVGDSLSGNPLVGRSLLGQSVSSVSTRDAVLAPQVLVSSSVPLKSEEETIGGVLGGLTVDNALLDGIQKTTGLASSIYADDKVSATTLLAEDGVTRRVGVVESNLNIVSKVLAKGETFTGSTSFLNTPYFASYLPLKDIDVTPVGMLFVGKPQVTVLQTAGRSIQASFVVAGILWLLAIIPSYLIASYISRQLK